MLFARKEVFSIFQDSKTVLSLKTHRKLTALKLHVICFILKFPVEPVQYNPLCHVWMKSQELVYEFIHAHKHIITVINIMMQGPPLNANNNIFMKLKAHYKVRGSQQLGRSQSIHSLP
jgi:hypothetical protein